MAQQVATAADVQIYQQYENMQQEQRAVMHKIAEVEADRHEHSLVADNLQPMASERKCFRLVGGILVERTVGEVRPLLQASVENLDKVLAVLNEQLTLKEKQMHDFAQKHGLKVGGNKDSGAAKAITSKDDKPAAGVLA